MKKLLTAAAMIVLTATANAQPLNRTHEYRVWSAERMIERLVDKHGKVIAAHPALSDIRNIAANGDDVAWAKLIDIVHQFEKDPTATLYR